MFGPTAHTAKPAAASKTGRFALLGALHRAPGSGAHSGRLVCDFEAPTEESGVRPVHRGTKRITTSVRTLVLVATLGLLVLGAEPALAAQSRPLITSFGTLSNPQGIAIDQSNGDVYVADTGNNRIEKFDSQGNFLLAFGANVGGPGVNTCSSVLTCVAGTPGSAPGQFTAAAFVAVDNSGGPSHGDVYVADTGDNLVSKFDSSGNLITSWGAGGQLNGSTATDGPFGTLAGITVDATGRLLVLNLNSQEFVFSQAGTFSSDFAVARPTNPSGVAVDTAGDFFKVNGDGSVEEFNSANIDLGQVTTSSASAIAVDPASGDLYVATTGNNAIDHYHFTAPGQVAEPGGSTCMIGSFSGCAASDSSPISFLPGHGIAVVSATDDTYVSNPSDGKVYEYGPAMTLPDVTTGQATGVQPSSATLSGTTNPDGVQVSSCQFEYGTDTTYGQSVPCAQSAAQIGSGTSPVPVSAALSGLQPNTSYHFRLDVGNANGTNQGQDQTFTTLGPPTDTGVASTDQTKTGSTVFSHVNPIRLDTHAHFDYGTTTGYGQSTQDTDIGSGADVQEVSALINGLQPNTVYHYRLVATNSAGTLTSTDHTFQTQGGCPNDQYRTGLGAYLPDCRAYEQVTPTAKGDALDISLKGLGSYGIFSTDGNTVLIQTPSVWPGTANVDPLTQDYFFGRSASGWNITNTLRPSGAAGLSSYGYVRGYTPDLSKIGFSLNQDAQNPGTAPKTVELGPPGGPFSVIATPQVGAGNDLFGTSVDLSHVILATKDSTLTPNAGGTSSGAQDLYDYTGGHLTLVNQKTDGSLASTCGADIHSGAQHPVSEDGSKIFFTTPSPPEGGTATDPSCFAQHHGWVRINSGSPNATTVDVGPVTSSTVAFLGASADGAKALFNTPSGVLLYDTITQTSTLVATSPTPNLGARISPDGSTVYFVRQDDSFMYRYDVATGHLDKLFQVDGFAQFNGVTQDGGVALFVAAAVPGRFAGSPYNEMYRYSAADSGLLCVTCHPDGGPMLNAADHFGISLPTEGPIALLKAEGTAPSALAGNGKYVFFQTSEQLVPRDTATGLVAAGVPSPAYNIFEWEAAGTGTCTDPAGCTHLITAGSDNVETDLIGATPDGSNVFFVTHDRLLGQDQDGLGDVYDARIGGGLPSPVVTAQCSADCQAPYSAQAAPAVATVSFNGPGNVIPATGLRAGKPRTTRLTKTIRTSALTKTIRTSAFTVSVSVPGAGRIVISGPRVRTARKAVGTRGRYTLKLTLTAAGKTALKHRHRLRITLRVVYSPASPAATRTANYNRGGTR
ncbi:MAG TPA: hypothetical protein VNY27_03025 [Solirubrobacteraceae bacterium]|jgi:sugar lactone lactonase YvrE|nr:hypothetical protein [Solirubrobacteraceae bacterium]